MTAEEPLLETTTASIGQTFDNKSVMELPVLGNSVMLMAGLAEGMQRTGGYNYLGLHSTVGASDYRTAGGVGGNDVTVTHADSGDTTTDIASQSTERLLSEGVAAVIGAATSAPTLLLSAARADTVETEGDDAARAAEPGA